MTPKTNVTVFERPGPDGLTRGAKPKRLNPQPLPHVEHPRSSDEARAEVRSFLEEKGWRVCGINSTGGGRAADGELFPEGLLVYVERMAKKPMRKRGR